MRAFGNFCAYARYLRGFVDKETKKTIQVLLADDHPIVMDGFDITLGRYGINVVAKAKTPEETELLYDAFLPDVAILDIRFGDKMTGLDAAKHILEKHPQAAIVFLSQFDQESLIREAYKIGAKAFVTKDCEPSELAKAVESAERGEVFFLPVIAERLAMLSVRGDESPQSLLDKRELELFCLIAKGYTIAEMAETLDVSEKTISNVSHSIKVKLDVKRAADITRLAIKHGIIDA